MASGSTPRSRATRRAVVRRFRPSRVARTMLCGFVEPRLLVRMSRTPAHSSTARTGPPAITPVPDAAGLSSTRPAPCLPTISCGMVPPVSGTSDILRRAASTALRTASLTSFALPVAIPTWPCPSPTATSALKLKRRPPLTTLATRLMAMTFSTTPSRVLVAPGRRPSELQSPFAGAVGHRLHAPVVLVTAAVEHDLHDALLLGLRRDELPQREAPRHLSLALHPDTLRAVRGARERHAPPIVHQLGVDVLRGAKHDQPRPLRRALHLLADAQVTAIAAVRRCLDLVDRSHGLFRRLSGLAGLAPHLLAHVADSLPLVGLGRPDVAQLGSHLSHQLLVHTFDLHQHVVIDRDLDALRRVVGDGMREPYHQLHAERLRLRLVTDALNLERFHEALGDTLDHIRHERPGQAVQRLVPGFVGRTPHHDRVLLHGQRQVGVDGAAELALRPLDGDAAPVQLRRHALGERNRLPADARHGVSSPLPDHGEQLAAHAGGAGFAVGHEPLRRAEDRHPEAVLHPRDLARLDVAAQAGRGDALQLADDARVVVVLEVEPQQSVTPVVQHLVVLDVVVVAEQPRDLDLQFRHRHVDPAMARQTGVAHAGQHVGDGISYAHLAYRPLPAGFTHAGNLPAQRKLTETDAAQLELAQRPSTP